jgi:opacity protein-like surface antigen
MKLHHVFTIVGLICMPAAALAQADRSASVSAAVSATNMDSRTSLSFSGAFEYRFSRVVGLELETTVVPTLKSTFPGDDRYTILDSGYTISAGLAPATSLVFPGPRYANPGGRVVIFSNNVRIVVPTTSTRLEPYFVAGGGIASIRRSADYVYQIYPATLATAFLDAAAPFPLPQPRTYTQRVTSSTVDMALTIGGGLSVRVARQVRVEADLRMFRLLGEVDRNSGRFGVGVRYRF